MTLLEREPLLQALTAAPCPPSPPGDYLASYRQVMPPLTVSGAPGRT